MSQRRHGPENTGSASRKSPRRRANIPTCVWVVCAAALLATVTGCSKTESGPPPQPSHPPNEAAPASQPATQPSEPEPNHLAPIDLNALQIPEQSWLTIEALEKGATGGWVNGNYPRPNKIVIETSHVTQFAMNLTELDLDWNRQVWVRIDRYAFELKYKRNPVIHLRAMADGAWELVEPP